MAGDASLLRLVFGLLDLLVDLLSDVLLGILGRKVETKHCISDSLSVAASFSDGTLWKGASQPEITDFDVAVLVNENVGGLEVAVDDVGRVKELERL